MKAFIKIALALVLALPQNLRAGEGMWIPLLMQKLKICLIWLSNTSGDAHEKLSVTPLIRCPKK